VSTWTGYVRFSSPVGDVIEEIDVDADSYEQAERALEAELDENYMPGGEIRQIDKRPDGFVTY